MPASLFFVAFTMTMNRIASISVCEIPSRDETPILPAPHHDERASGESTRI
jgi:hypothetical protein